MPADLIDGLITGLMEDAGACRYADWPGELAHLDRPGLYAWWADAEAAALISARLGDHIPKGIVYLGQAGALKGGKEPSATLGRRLSDDHINGKIRNSTFRHTISAVLLEEVRAHIVRDRAIGATGESMVSGWLARHFRVTTVPFDDRRRLAAVESQVLARIDPPLNLKGMQPTAARQALTERRGVLRQSVMRPRRNTPILSSDSELIPVRRKAGSVTLHEEIEEILVDNLNRWMKTSEIADLVNQRGFYIKRNLTKMTDFQIHGRTRNYSNIFERNGAKVRLISGRSSGT